MEYSEIIDNNNSILESNVNNNEENINYHNNIVKMVTTIESLDKLHHIEIAKILKKYNIFLSENKNGIFVNMTNINKEIYDEINVYLKFIQNQEKNIKKDEKLKKNLEITYFKDNKDNLQ